MPLHLSSVLQWPLGPSGYELHVLHRLYWVLMRQPAAQTGRLHPHNPSRNSLDDPGRVPFEGGHPRLSAGSVAGLSQAIELLRIPGIVPCCGAGHPYVATAPTSVKSALPGPPLLFLCRPQRSPHLCRCLCASASSRRSGLQGIMAHFTDL